MGVKAQTYTTEDIKGMNPVELQAAVPEILKAFNQGKRQDMKLWEVYHEAALKLESSRHNCGSQNEWRQKLNEGAPSFDPLSL